ncbi:unnamed protein product [Cylindrotheca closterium]|uniref:Cytochrome b5 heme-binding domain-containing protein n=1 Tax=Cylindrotheca closterium TaxID=2856 RepID=A0AAD2CWB6_9STRA|nr:unnamed protein product [Cylindrotheca closterium]
MKASKGRRHRDEEMASSRKSSHRHVPRSVRRPLFEEDMQDFQRRKRPVYARLIALMLGMVTLVAAGFGAYFFLEKDEIVLQKGKSQHDNFQGVVAMETIVEHTQPEDCWMSIHGKVYDMTEYAPVHPGPPSLITNHCGTDATNAYDIFHSISLLPIVNEYLLGTLEEITTSPPTSSPSSVPSMVPTTSPPSRSPTASPSTSPPTRSPTISPSAAPSMRPTTPRPTEPEATPFPTSSPSTSPPTKTPTPPPTMRPTPSPTRPPTPSPTNRPTPRPTDQGCTMEFYTMSDVAQHPNSGSCWYALYGVVFDFTNYIDRHPGGRRTALAGCGIDSKSAYESESGHNRNLLRRYSSYIIGRVGTTRTTGTVPCNEVDLVAVN